MCVAPLCIAVLVARHAASAQDNGAVKSDELPRTNLNCNRQNSIPCQSIAQVGLARDQAEVRTGGNDLRGAHDLEAQEMADDDAADSQVRPDSTSASQPREKEAPAILEVGAEPARSLSGTGWTVSPTVAVEVTPIENWLELEFGVTPTFSHHSTEWDTDYFVQIQKPPGLSPRK
jgi:hypothetical protein